MEQAYDALPIAKTAPYSGVTVGDVKSSCTDGSASCNDTAPLAIDAVIEQAKAGTIDLEQAKGLVIAIIERGKNTGNTDAIEAAISEINKADLNALSTAVTEASALLEKELKFAGVNALNQKLDDAFTSKKEAEGHHYIDLPLLGTDEQALATVGAAAAGGATTRYILNQRDEIIGLKNQLAQQQAQTPQTPQAQTQPQGFFRGLLNKAASKLGYTQQQAQTPQTPQTPQAPTQTAGKMGTKMKLGITTIAALGAGYLAHRALEPDIPDGLSKEDVNTAVNETTDEIRDRK